MEKPFLCSHLDCKMTFTNEDHLEVHKKCHENEMSQHIIINNFPTKLPTFVIDQTPTPTNCLKHCEDVSLFHDITLNPFDEEFRKASQLKTQLSVPDNSAADSLETPKIPPLVDSDGTISSTSKDISSYSESCTNSTSYINTNSCGFKNQMARIQDTTTGENDKYRKMRLTINVSSPESNDNPKLISTPTPVITAGPSVSQILVTREVCPVSQGLSAHYSNSAVLEENSFHESVHNEMSEVSPVTVDFSQYSTALECSSVQRSNSPQKIINPCQSRVDPVVPSPATVLQLVLRLPNGQSIPVEIPATPIVSSSGLTKAVVTVAQSNARLVSDSYVPSQSSVNNGSSIAKMKLKQALTSCNTAAKPGSSKFSRANTADRIAEMTRSRTASETFYKEEDSIIHEFTHSEINSQPIYQVKRRRMSCPGDDPLDKRVKFLERNRVAAVRCREKKKQFVKNLFTKSDELEGINKKLQGDVCTLKSEVALLKTMLLQHKDCPVTLAMQNENAAAESFPKTFTTFKIQQPSGVITQITTTPVTNFSPQSQPDDTVDDTTHPVVSEVAKSKKLITSLNVGVKTDKSKPRPIAAGPSKTQSGSSSSVVVGSNVVLPDNLCLPSAVSSPSSVILINHPNSLEFGKNMTVNGSKQSFLVPKAVALSRRDENTVYTTRPNSSPSATSQCVLSLDSSSREVFTLNQLQSAKRS